MKVSIEKNELVIRLPLDLNPQPSKSGKNLGVATTHGNQKTGVAMPSGPTKGREITVGINAYVKNGD
jgi:hypothetical protein